MSAIATDSTRAIVVATGASARARSASAISDAVCGLNGMM